MPGVRGEVAVEPVCSEMAANRGVYLRCRRSGRRSASPAASAPMQISYSSIFRGVGSSPTTKVFVRSSRGCSLDRLDPNIPILNRIAVVLEQDRTILTLGSFRAPGLGEISALSMIFIPF